MRRAPAALIRSLLALAVITPAAPAQESLLPNTSWGAIPSFATWHFSTPIAQGGGGVSDLSQFALPLRVRTVLGDRWTLDISGAATSSSMQLKSGGATRTLSLTGITDAKVRVSGSALADWLHVTAGVNLPIGTTGLSADQTSVLQEIGAPALHMPVTTLGLGTGWTLGAISARESGPWALALGASIEGRSEYTPVELALAAGKASTNVTPGTAVHVTLGADRDLGDKRLSLLLAADAYTKDKVSTTSNGNAGSSSSYTLGPQVTALARMDFAAAGWRESALNTSYRFRSEYSDGTGKSTPGTSGSYLEASWGGVRGEATGRGLIVGVDARYHSGLKFTDALVGASTTGAGGTIGAELPFTGATLRLALHAQYAQFNTGTTSTNGMGLSLFGAIAARKEAR